MTHFITGRKYVPSKICPLEKVSVDNMSIEKTSWCQKYGWSYVKQRMKQTIMGWWKYFNSLVSNKSRRLKIKIQFDFLW